MNLEEIRNYNPFKYSEKLIRKYMKKLNYSDNLIETSFDIIETVETVLQRFDVREKQRDWNNIGVQLKKGKVVLPPGMQEVVDELVKENLLYSYFLPEKFGGLGRCEFIIGPLTEILSYYDMSLQMLIMLGFTVLEGLLFYYKEAFDGIIQDFADGKRKSGYVGFTEPQAGSNLEAIKATSEKVGDEYVLNGTKIYQTNGGYAEQGLFLAKNMVNGDAKGTNVFLVPNLDNIEVLRLEEKSGIHASPTAQLRFENVTVPEEYLLGDRGDGYEKVLERLLGMRIGVAFQAVSATRRAYELGKSYAEDRVQFGKSIIEFPAIQRKLMEIKRQLPRMQDYSYRAAFALDRFSKGWVPADVGAEGKQISEVEAAKHVPEQVKKGLMHYFASSAKLYTSEITNYLLYDAQQIFGGSGFVSETEINKIVGDCRVLSIYDGTTEIQEFILTKSQPALDFLPKFERTYSWYENKTIYEKFLFEKFPDIEKKL